MKKYRGLIIAIVVILISLFALIASRYKKCPSDKIMVIYLWQGPEYR